MMFFTATTLFDALYDLVPDCGCFGTAIKMSNWQTFYKNLVIDAVLIPLIINNKKLENKMTGGTQFIIGCLYALVFLGFEVYNYRHLPVVDFINWKVGKQLNVETSGDADIYLIYRNKATGETQEFLSPNYPWNDSVWMSLERRRNFSRRIILGMIRFGCRSGSSSTKGRKAAAISSDSVLWMNRVMMSPSPS